MIVIAWCKTNKIFICLLSLSIYHPILLYDIKTVKKFIDFIFLLIVWVFNIQVPMDWKHF